MPYSRLMNKPDSFVVSQLIEFLDYIEKNSSASLETINHYTANDTPNGIGYAMASGHAKSTLEYYVLKAQTLRSMMDA